MTHSTVRTRFAPSPTGSMHIGNLRTALYAFLVARHAKGQFILRIEDTDQARYVEGAVEVIYSSLRQTGLTWDEGPDCGGPVGPYVQSERKALYGKYADELVAKGHAYRCFCTTEELEEIRRQAEASASPIAAYDGRCGRLTPAQVESKLAAKLPFTIRQRIDRTGATSFQDLVYGEITISSDQLDDQVLMKQDGMPTYNFANVVDDHLMGITHVMRGVEYLPSTPKYMQLYAAFGWTAPVNIHLPHILGPSGKKLSKRDGAAALSDFIQKGYLPEAILNYVALLGWNPGDDTEFFTLAQLVERFDIARIHKASATFDEPKLRHLNSLHLKALTPEQFHAVAVEWMPAEVRKRFDTHRIASLIHPRVEALADIPEMLGFLLQMPFPYERALYEHKKMKTTVEGSLPILEELRGKLVALDPWNETSIHQLLNDFTVAKGVKAGVVFWPLRVALTGLASTPGGATEVAALLGRDETLARLEKSISLLK